MKDYLLNFLHACIVALVLPLCFLLIIIILLGVSFLFLLTATVVPAVVVIAALFGFDVSEITIG